MMNRDRLAYMLPAFYTCAAISNYRQFSCGNPATPPVSLNPANIKVGFLTRPAFGYVGVAANAVAKLSVMIARALLVIPWDSFKGGPAVGAGMNNVSHQPLAFIWRWLTFVRRRQSKSVLIAYGVASIIIPVLRCVSPMALFRAKAGRFHAVVRDAVFVKARRALKFRHGGKMPDCPVLSRQYLGSGSHAIAAHYFGAHLTACEIDADYFAAATARIQRETAQTTFL